MNRDEFNKAVMDELERMYGGTVSKAEPPPSLTMEKMMEQIRLLEKEYAPPPVMYAKTALDGSMSQVSFDQMIFLDGGRREDAEMTLTMLKDRSGRSPLPGTPIYLVNPDLMKINSGLKLDWSEPEPAPEVVPEPEAPKMTFKEFTRSRWYDYLVSVGPPIAVFSFAPFVATLEPWFYVVAPLATMFLGGITVFRHYNQWYPYYGPDGMLKKDK